MWARPDRFSETNAIDLASGDRTLYVAFLAGIGNVDIPVRAAKTP